MSHTISVSPWNPPLLPALFHLESEDCLLCNSMHFFHCQVYLNSSWDLPTLLTISFSNISWMSSPLSTELPLKTWTKFLVSCLIHCKTFQIVLPIPIGCSPVCSPDIARVNISKYRWGCASSLILEMSLAFHGSEEEKLNFLPISSWSGAIFLPGLHFHVSSSFQYRPGFNFIPTWFGSCPCQQIASVHATPCSRLTFSVFLRAFLNFLTTLIGSKPSSLHCPYWKTSISKIICLKCESPPLTLKSPSLQNLFCVIINKSTKHNILAEIQGRYT